MAGFEVALTGRFWVAPDILPSNDESQLRLLLLGFVGLRCGLQKLLQLQARAPLE